MVILRIVLENFGFLLVVKIANQIIHTELVAPLLVLDEPRPLVSTSPLNPSACDRTFVWKARHRISELSRTATGSRCPNVQCILLVQVSLAAGVPGHLVLWWYGQGGQTATQEQSWESHSRRTSDPAPSADWHLGLPLTFSTY